MFYFGVDYYPEHWSTERMKEDIRLMSLANINLVRLAEFAWSKMEPSEGVVDFDWLDDAIKALHQHGIKVVLGTPTASPPAWLMTKDKTLFRVDKDGRRLMYGGRREYCPNHPVYRDYTRKIVTALVNHYHDNPDVVGWQIDNELGDRCYCDICKEKFQNWLQKRYKTLDRLNAGWGTVFWSHTYTEWSQIPVPGEMGGIANPGLALDYSRFVSDTYVSYQNLQADLIRQKCKNQFITHNLMGFQYPNINYYDLAKGLDCLSWDVYCRTQWNMDERMDPSWFGLGHDCMRGLKSKPFWVMEQQSGPAGWDIVGGSTKPGDLRNWAYQSIAHGADAIVFFRWRTARYGAEQYWHGILDHHGKPGRRYFEIQQMGREIKTIGDQIQGAETKASVAFILSYDSRFALEIQKNNLGLDYANYFHALYHAFDKQHVAVDIVPPTADLSSYKIVVAPLLHVVTDEIASNLKKYVKAGGTLVLSPRSGVKDINNAVVDRPLPGLLAELCGIEIEEYVSLSKNDGNEIEFDVTDISESAMEVGVWCDIIKPVEARVLASYRQDFFSGKPAITENNYGEGKAIYLGVIGNNKLNDCIANWILKERDVKSLLETQNGVEVCERRKDGRRFLFIINHTESDQEILLDGDYCNLLDDSSLEGGKNVVLQNDVLILTQAL